MTVAVVSILVCLGVVLTLLWLLRRDRVSLGLPVAYMIALLLIHLPGAYAFVVSNGVYGGTATAVGMRLTAIGAVFFLVGVAAANSLKLFRPERPASPPGHPRYGAAPPQPPGPRYWMFCLLGGWLLVFGVSTVIRIPTIGAAVDKGGAIWMLGVMLGLASAFQQRNPRQIAFWGLMMFIYPAMMLLVGGFLSYGSTAVIVICSILFIAARRYWVSVAGLAVGSFLGLSIFVNYFVGRGELRAAVWGGASMDERLEVVGGIIRRFSWFSVDNPFHLNALDQRLNQNYFVGMAAERLELGLVDLLYGRSVWEGLLALVPRILWPEKPVFGGSGSIVADMTGLRLNENTSWGVGNVMEFYINFGTAGVAAGFAILGCALAILDRKTAEALSAGQLGQAFIFFLPCVAMIQPNGSIVELSGGAAAALLAAYFWRWAWRAWTSRQPSYAAPPLHRRL